MTADGSACRVEVIIASNAVCTSSTERRFSLTPPVSLLCIMSGEQIFRTTGKPISILIKGDGEHSNIIYALRGTAGTLWDKNNPAGFGQMPAGGPFFPSDQIDDLSDWITKGCNQGATA